MTDPLIRIGFWRSDLQPQFPDPADWVDENWDGDSRHLTAYYFDAGAPARAYMGVSMCRLCGQVNGSLDYSDGVYIWPEGLAHYVREHSVRLPARVVQYAIDKVMDLESRDDDDTWWCASRPSSLRAQIAMYPAEQDGLTSPLFCPATALSAAFETENGQRRAVLVSGPTDLFPGELCEVDLELLDGLGDELIAPGARLVLWDERPVGVGEVLTNGSDVVGIERRALDLAVTALMRPTAELVDAAVTFAEDLVAFGYPGQHTLAVATLHRRTSRDDATEPIRMMLGELGLDLPLADDKGEYRFLLEAFGHRGLPVHHLWSAVMAFLPAVDAQSPLDRELAPLLDDWDSASSPSAKDAVVESMRQVVRNHVPRRVPR